MPGISTSMQKIKVQRPQLIRPRFGVANRIAKRRFQKPIFSVNIGASLKQ